MRVEPPTPDDTLDERLSRADALARRLQTEIARSALRPGHRIGTKAELQQRFGVAAATVNEAVRMMEARGLVDARRGPGGGVFVAKESARSRLAQMMFGFDAQATLGDCVAVRNALEPLVATGAAEAAKPRDIKDLNRLVDAMEASIDDSRSYLRVNWALHRRIARICRNGPLKAMYSTVIDVLDDGLDDFEFEGPNGPRVELHRRLVEAIAAGPGPHLDRIVAEHRDGSPLPS